MENNKLLQEIEAIEQQLKSDPDSSGLWFELFSRFFQDRNLYAQPKRIENILRYIQNNPRDQLCITPFVQVDPKISKEGYEKIKNIWNKLLKENSDDAKIVRGAANFYCSDDIDLAKKVLRNFLDKDPIQAEVWLDLGRYTLDAKERLEYLDEAGKHGSRQPNLQSGS